MPSALDAYVDARRFQDGKGRVYFELVDPPSLKALFRRWRQRDRFLLTLEEKWTDASGQHSERVQRLVVLETICQDAPELPDLRRFHGRLYLEENSPWAFSFDLDYTNEKGSPPIGNGSWA